MAPDQAPLDEAEPQPTASCSCRAEQQEAGAPAPPVRRFTGRRSAAAANLGTAAAAEGALVRSTAAGAPRFVRQQVGIYLMPPCMQSQ